MTAVSPPTVSKKRITSNKVIQEKNVEARAGTYTRTLLAPSLNINLYYNEIKM